MRRLALSLAIMGRVGVVVAPALASNVFFSTVSDVGGGVAVGNPDLTVSPGENLTLYIWSTDDQDYDTTIGMNVVASPEDVIAFTGAVVENPELLSNAFDPPLPSGKLRWMGTNDGVVDASAVRKMHGVTLGFYPDGDAGVTEKHDGTQGPKKFLDPLYDLDAGAFRLGSVSFDVIGDLGVSTTLTIDQEATSLFVDNVDGHGTQMFPDFGTATINVTDGIPGDAPDNPVMPDETTAGGIEIFEDVPLDQLTSLDGVQGLWFDPPSIRSLRVEITDGASVISDVGLPAQGSGPGEYPDSDGLYSIAGVADGDGVVDVNVNQIHRFAAGVTDFTITGVDSVLPPDEAADLPIFLAFGQSDDGKVSLQITHIPVPEPSSLAIALPVLLCWRRKRRRMIVRNLVAET